MIGLLIDVFWLWVRNAYDHVFGYSHSRPVHYRIGLTWYTVVLPKPRLGRRVTATDVESGEDVTESLRAPLGPGRDFHGIPTTPRMLGYDKGLVFCGRETRADETIRLP